jgi:hypothetical protein
VNSTITPQTELAKAVRELEEQFPARVTAEVEEAGVVVTIAEVSLGSGWSAPSGTLGFLLPFHYPDAAIYPYHVTGALPERVSDSALQPVTWRGAPATQVSLRHTNWNPAHDTALGSVLITLARLRVQ